MDNGFDIPIVLFLFKRSDTVLRIIKVLSEIKPQKIYLLSDQGRDEKEKQLVEKTRNVIEKSIDWECELIKNYAVENRGVYRNIGEGARWVFEREKIAIFLEDELVFSLIVRNYWKDTRIIRRYYGYVVQIIWESIIRHTAICSHNIYCHVDGPLGLINFWKIMMGKC